MKKVKLKIGDTAWFYLGDHQGKMTDGKVIGLFPYYGQENYIIEIDTPMDPYLIIREPMSVSDAPDKPIGLWRKIYA
ncbi:MAG TPA: hypothetical protein VFR24_27530 [Candidatus Angelobacter sp.]|nr:hypothetical protein [Candidatus Angelobacter sp.]